MINILNILCLKAIGAVLSLAILQEASFPSLPINQPVTEHCITEATQLSKIYACPRCRRVKPKGPKKRPHPGFKKQSKTNLKQAEK